MVERAALGPSDRVLEIGPGRGVLTREVLGSSCARVDAVELDIKLKKYLEPIARMDERLALHWEDAVCFDYSKLEAPPTHVIANLPYYITTPVIWAILESFPDGGARYMLLMVQKETALRLSSGAGARASCPLGITLAAMGNISTPRQASRGSFSPIPRVDSAIVEIKLFPESRGLNCLPNDKKWRRLLSGSFAQRRKTLANNWAGAFGMPKETASAILAAHSLGSRSRPEELPIDAWLSLLSDEKISCFL
jgi:16S rRNA (adenine1518-N6/adenine1519-N6)-dimethyltransferase